MAVKAGYKQSELGVIPEDWEVRPMAELFTFQNGVNADKTAYGNGVPFINVLEVITHPVITETGIPGRVTLSDEAINTFAVRHGDVLFNRTSETQEEVGLASVYLGKEAVVFGGFVIRARAREPRMHSGFMCYALRSSVVRRQIVARGQGAIRANIGQQELARVHVVLPTRAEQEAIAEALSDADALIESLEQLLAKKRKLKQGAMQELLTGKARLPGFDGVWRTKRLGATAVLKARIGWQGLTTAEYLGAGDYFLVTGTEFKGGQIDWSSCYAVTELRYKQDKHIQLRVHDVLVTKDGTIGKVAFICHLPKPATLNSGVFVIRPIEDAFHPAFFYFLLCSSAFTDFLVQLSAGSTITHLYQKDFVNFRYRIPATLPEQSAIATILSDMDAELAALEAKLAKARSIKQGMMHELLTGGIRLL